MKAVMEIRHIHLDRDQRPENARTERRRIIDLTKMAGKEWCSVLELSKHEFPNTRYSPKMLMICRKKKHPNSKPSEQEETPAPRPEPGQRRDAERFSRGKRTYTSQYMVLFIKTSPGQNQMMLKINLLNVLTNSAATSEPHPSLWV
jgi:hypothetical protein